MWGGGELSDLPEIGTIIVSVLFIMIYTMILLYAFCIEQYREKFYKSNGEDYGVVTIDLKDGNCQRYKADEIPEWIDFKSTQPK